MPFPLPLAPFELLMLWDDRPGYPMEFELACEFSGQIEPQHFEEAVRLVLLRHPLLAARIENVNGFPNWVHRASPPSVIHWALDDTDPTKALIEFHKQGPAAGEPGLRILVYRHRDRMRMDWRFHHSHCDGIAGCVVIGDALAIYHGLCTGTDWQPALKPLDNGRLLARADFRGGRKSVPSPVVEKVARSRSAGLWSLFRGSIGPINEAMQFVFRTPRAVAASSPAASGSIGLPLLSRTFDVEQTQGIGRSAQALGVSVNDLVVASFFATLYTWNSERAGADPRRYLRVTMPTSLRVPGDAQMPAANRMSYAFLDRRGTECHELAPLAAGIRQSTLAIQRQNLSRQFVETLAIVASKLKLLRLLLRRRACFSTAVLSNIGDPSRRFDARLQRDQGKVIAGALRMETMYGAPPLRPETRLGVGITSYCGELSLSAMMGLHAVSAADGEELLSRVADALLTVHDVSPPIRLNS